MTYEIRTAGINDFRAVKDFMIKALEESPLAFSVDVEEYANNEDEWWHRYIDNYLLGNFQTLLLAFDKGEKPIGMIGVLYERGNRKKHIATIVWFYVNAGYRGQGLGKSLLKRVMEIIINNTSAEKINLMVNSAQLQAQSMYIKEGFQVAGKLEKDLRIKNEYYDVLILEKFIERVR